MTSTIRHITVDANDPYALAQFWSAVTGYPVEESARPGDDEILIEAPEPLPGILFERVPEPKTAKNRMHLDVTPQTTRDEELARILALGATIVQDHRQADGRGWVWCADPEGNAGGYIPRMTLPTCGPGPPERESRHEHHHGTHPP